MLEPRRILVAGLLLATLLGADVASAHSGMILLALDSSGNGTDLEPVNAWRDPVPARSGNAMTFNGTNAYLVKTSTATQTLSMTGAGTLACAWVKINTNTGTHVIAQRPGNWYFNQSGTSTTLELDWGSTTSGYTKVTLTSPTSVLTFGVWRHACFGVDPGASNPSITTTLTLWIDGEIRTTDARATGTNNIRDATPSATVYLGGNPADTATLFNGWLDTSGFCQGLFTTFDAFADTLANGTTGTPCNTYTKARWTFDEIVTGAPTTAPVTGYIDPVNLTGEAPYSRWMHVRGDTSTLELRIDLDGDGVNDRVVTGNVWDERVTWTKVGLVLFHVQFIDQFGRAQHNETPIRIIAPTASGLTLKPTDTTGGKPLTRLVTVEGDPRVVNIKVDYDGDGAYDREVNNSTFGALHTWTAPGSYRLNVVATNDANVSSYRESIITVQDDEAPTATIYPEPGTRGLAPFTRWVVVRGDASVRTIRIDYEGDGTWDETANARSHNVEHTWTQPGIARLVVQLKNEHGTNATYDIPLRIENTLVQDPLTSDRSCDFCHFGDDAKTWNDLTPTFTPKEVWNWLVFLALVAVAGFVLYFRIINGGT